MEDEMLKLSGDEFDDAIVGTALVWQKNNRVETMIYKGEKIVEILVEQGLSEEEALDHVSYNIEGAYVGPSTPIIAWEYHEQQPE